VKWMQVDRLVSAYYIRGIACYHCLLYKLFHIPVSPPQSHPKLSIWGAAHKNVLHRPITEMP